jgi:hypothetical protein
MSRPPIGSPWSPSATPAEAGPAGALLASAAACSAAFEPEAEVWMRPPFARITPSTETWMLVVSFLIVVPSQFVAYWGRPAGR